MRDRIILIILSALLLCSGCSPVSPAVSAAKDSPAPDSPYSSPQAALPAETVIDTVTVKTSREWNDFARSFNASAKEYAEPLTIAVEGRLNFLNQPFVPLARPFSGVIRGSKAIDPYTPEVMLLEKYFSTNALADEGYGFYGIRAFEKAKTEQPIKVFSSQDRSFWNGSYDEYVRGGTWESSTARSMFGIRCGDLTLENLVFSGIHAEGLATLFALSADSLTIRNVLVEDCGVRETNAILAENAGRADLENVFIARCDAELETSGGGLLDWVSENASFRRIGLANVSVFLYPDGGGSGYTAGSAGLLVSKIGGSASFEEIESYRCTMYTLNSAALCFEPGSLAVCSDILVDSGSFLGFPNGKSMMGFPVNNLLFGWNETADNAQNVILRDSVFNPYKPLEDYTAFTIENCIAVTDREQ